MIKLFETLSVNDIIIYIVLIFLAIKGIIDAIFWIKDKSISTNKKRAFAI